MEQKPKIEKPEPEKKSSYKIPSNPPPSLTDDPLKKIPLDELIKRPDVIVIDDDGEL